MCRQLTECACLCICACMCNHQPAINHQQNLCRVSLQIKQPYQCVCQPCSKTTQIQTNDVVAGLLKYNSNLTKYLAKYQLVPSQSSPKQEMKSEDYRGTVRQPQKSIAQLYNLKYLSPHDHPLPAPPPQPNPASQQNNKIDNFVQTSPRNGQQVDPHIDNKNSNKNEKNKRKKGKPKYEEGSNQDKIQKHLDQVAKSSRYLPNSGFKKYFGRECFENYGRQNTTGVADGIVYNNYLKTFNIAPHSGGNMPITEETYKRTLMAGDTNNYDGRKIPDTHYLGREERQDAEGYHTKPIIDMPKLIEQSQNKKIEIKKFERPKYEPNLNIISHCPDIKTSKQFQRSYNPTTVRQKIAQTNYRQNQVAQRRESSGGYRDQQRIEEPGIKIQEQPIRRGGNRNNLPDLSSIRQEQDGRTRYVQENRNMYENRYQRAEQVQNGNRYERWDDKGITGCDRMRKKQILQGCYRNAEVGRTISGASKQKCEICKSRRYTKCCCIN